MNVAVHECDHTGFPNLAIMKLSAWHKAQGDEVEWYNPLMEYDRVYSSKVFTFTPEDPYLPLDAVRGGTGYGKYDELPPDVDAIFPDYSLYPNVRYAIGYLTRGCVRKCPWCVVPKKEGWIHRYDTWQNIRRADSNQIVFMDNNVLASEHGIEQMEQMIGQDLRIDFNQGLDARLITPEIADIIGRLKWIHQIRLACDTDEMLDVVLEKGRMLQEHGVKAWRLFIYVLVQDIESAEKRCVALRSAGYDPFAQPYRDFTTNAEPAEELKRFARWVNRKEIFNKVKSFSDYKRGHQMTP